MHNDFIISPSFIDRNVPELAQLSLAGARINDPERLGDGQQAKATCVHRPLAEFVAQSARQGRAGGRSVLPVTAVRRFPSLPACSGPALIHF